MRRIFPLLMMFLLSPPAPAVDYMLEARFNDWLGMAKQGYADAQYAVGDMYLKGRGVYVDQVKALAWFRKSASQGNRKAEFKLGYMLLKGMGENRDPRRAFGFLESAAGKGYAPAQFFLGQMYALGDGVQRNNILALKWLTESIQDGYRPRKEEIVKIRIALDRMIQEGKRQEKR